MKNLLLASVLVVIISAVLFTSLNAAHLFGWSETGRWQNVSDNGHKKLDTKTGEVYQWLGSSRGWVRME